MSKQESFCIQCPCCLEWTPYPVSPDEIAFTQLSELKKFLRGLKSSSFDRQILRCKSETWICASPFEAVIYSGKDCLNIEEIIVPASWMDVYTFRLRRTPRNDDHIPGYHAVLFCTKPVQFLPGIQLEYLLNLDLLSKAIHGICAHVKSPITVYAARVLNEDNLKVQWIFNDACKDNVCWLPVETYDEKKENPLLPPGSNLYCEAKRHMYFDHMKRIAAMSEWGTEDKKKRCPLEIGDKGKCGGVNAACERKDWNLCPAFLHKRWEYDNCYSSDLGAIGSIRTAWNDNKSIEIYPYDCETGFHERAVPIVVHEHLVGVAFCGQAFDNNVIKKLNPNKDIQFFDEYITKLKKDMEELKSDGGCLEIKLHIDETKENKEKWQDKLDKVKKELKEYNDERFKIDPHKLEEEAERLYENIEKIQDLASIRYLHLRARTEAFFRREVLQGIRKEYQKNRNTDFIQNMLDRMRTFWLFNIGAIFRFVYDREKRSLRFGVPVLSSLYHSKARLTGKGGSDISAVMRSVVQEDLDTIKKLLDYPNPFHHLYKHGENRPLSPLKETLMKRIKGIEIQVDGKVYMYEDDKMKFFVAVPVSDQIWLFAFIERDMNGVSPLRPKCDYLSISSICQESIRETCIEVAHEIFKADLAVRHRQKFEQQGSSQEHQPARSNVTDNTIRKPTDSGKSQNSTVSLTGQTGEACNTKLSTPNETLPQERCMAKIKKFTKKIANKALIWIKDKKGKSVSSDSN